MPSLWVLRAQAGQGRERSRVTHPFPRQGLGGGGGCGAAPASAPSCCGSGTACPSSETTALGDTASRLLAGLSSPGAAQGLVSAGRVFSHRRSKPCVVPSYLPLLTSIAALPLPRANTKSSTFSMTLSCFRSVPTLALESREGLPGNVEEHLEC